MSSFVLYLLVFVSGASVLAIEILGTRILGPFYGVSLYLWSALITVTLLALALGYWSGGRQADRTPAASALAILFAGAGLWIFLIPWMRAPVLHLAEPLGLRAAVLVAAILLFGPPLVLLGMVSPFAIRLRAHSLNRIGQTAGDLFAVSTVASVVSALATGFWLIPRFGVSSLTRSIGVLLMVGGLAAWLIAHRGSRTRAQATGWIGLCIAAAALALFSVGAGSTPPPDVLAVRQSPYGEIRVVSHEEKRFLLIDGGIHTVVSPDNWETYFAYVPVFDIPRMFFDRPGRLLLVGLGGGSVARNYAAENWRVDAVEIDAAVTAVAREFFGFTDSDATVYEMDGRAFLMAHEGPWDIIAVDAFGSSSIPFHLVSAEAFALLASRLSPEGILAVNIEAVGWNDPLVSAIAATLRRSFGQVVALPIAEPPNMVGNLVLLACDRPLEFDEERLGRPYHLLAQPYLHWCSVQRNHAWNNRFQPDTRGAPVFTDELNPVDLMTESVNLAARRNLHENPELRGLAW